MTLPEGLVEGADGVVRCWWPGDDPAYVAYHDTEWGRPTTDDHLLFEKLCLEGFQAGLSWLTILRKRPAFREVFHGFDPERVAAMDDDDVERLLGDARIVRHRGKVEATVHNARRLLALYDEVDAFATWIWSFAPDDHERPSSRDAIPTETAASRALSRELKRRGWRFVGPTTAYAFMQSEGLVDDHVRGCEPAP